MPAADPFLVAIPSYHRPAIAFEKTIRYCLDYLAIDPRRIYLFLVEEDPDREAYLAAAVAPSPTFPHPLQVRWVPAGLHHARNAMGRFFADLAAITQRPVRVLYLDDDIDHFVRMTVREDQPLRKASRYPIEPVPPADLLDAVVRAFQALDAPSGPSASPLDLFGFYPVANGYFMKDLPEVTRDLRFCVGAAYGMVHRPGAAPYELVLEEKEDFERTLLSYERNGGVLRLNRLAPVTAYYRTPGGLQARAYDRKAAAAAACAHLLARFPHLCRAYHGKKTGMPEVRLGQGAASAGGSWRRPQTPCLT